LNHLTQPVDTFTKNQVLLIMKHIKTILQRIELDIKSKQQASRDAESVKRLRKEIEGRNNN
jgi:hypothetical protein